MGTGHDSQWQYRALASGDWVFGAGPAGCQHPNDQTRIFRVPAGWKARRIVVLPDCPRGVVNNQSKIAGAVSLLQRRPIAD